MLLGQTVTTGIKNKMGPGVPSLFAPEPQPGSFQAAACAAGRMDGAKLAGYTGSGEGGVLSGSDPVPPFARIGSTGQGSPVHDGG